jgi:hypothetical protein
MILVFPQGTAKFNKLFIEMIKKSQASLFLDKSLSAYNMKKISKVLLIILENKKIEKFLTKYFSNSSINKKVEIFSLKKKTSGSICTILMTIPILKKKSVMISSLDQIIIGKKIEVNNLPNKQSKKIVVPIIKSNNKNLCYILKDDLGNVVQLFEKKKLSDEAILGIYFFKDFSDFLKSCLDLLIKYKGFKDKVFYTSDVINDLMINQEVSFPLLKLRYFKIRSLDSFKKFIKYSKIND